jgi:hypothetical protein
VPDALRVLVCLFYDARTLSWAEGANISREKRL